MCCKAGRVVTNLMESKLGRSSMLGLLPSVCMSVLAFESWLARKVRRLKTSWVGGKGDGESWGVGWGWKKV